MAGTTRKTAKIFGGSLAAPNNIAKFGSLKAGAPAYSLDLDDIQTAAWLNGWAAAVVTVGGNPNVPPLQDVNAIEYALSKQIAYLLERGIPEYDAATEYNLYDICRVNGVTYQSRIDANTGNAPGASPTQWASLNLACSVANTGQSVLVDGNGHTVDFDTETFDTDAAFDSATNTFTAPVAGIYEVSAYVQVDNDDADASTIEFALRVIKNAGVALANGTSVANPPGSRWYPSVQGLVQLAAGDTLLVQLSATDGVGTNHVDLSNGNLSIHRVRAA
jgi:hypothetical protein